VLFLKLFEFILVDTLTLVLAFTLGNNLNFESLLVSVLEHHSLQFEGVSIELHPVGISLNHRVL
jgi:hypothetical protein